MGKISPSNPDKCICLCFLMKQKFITTGFLDKTVITCIDNLNIKYYIIFERKRKNYHLSKAQGGADMIWSYTLLTPDIIFSYIIYIFFHPSYSFADHETQNLLVNLPSLFSHIILLIFSNNGNSQMIHLALVSFNQSKNAKTQKQKGGQMLYRQNHQHEQVKTDLVKCVHLEDPCDLILNIRSKQRERAHSWVLCKEET